MRARREEVHKLRRSVSLRNLVRKPSNSTVLIRSGDDQRELQIIQLRRPAQLAAHRAARRPRAFRVRTRNLFNLGELTVGFRGFAKLRGEPCSYRQLTPSLAVATLGTAVLIEIGVFILLGMI